MVKSNRAIQRRQLTQAGMVTSVPPPEWTFRGYVWPSHRRAEEDRYVKMHNVQLSPDMVARVMKRRGGKMHAFERLDPARTALIVIDMQNAWVREDGPGYSPYCRSIVPNINRLAATTRAAGGSVWRVRAIYEDAPRTWSSYMEFLSPEFLGDMLTALSEGNEGSALWHELDIKPGDQHVVKRRFSALIQGSSDLDARLRAAGIDTLIITGTATNVCCESTARDAFMLNYRTLVVSDANATASDEAHNASLNALFNRFADVFTTDEVTVLLEAGTQREAVESPRLRASA
jgi:ureidoacrylate peracid hydrolase